MPNLNDLHDIVETQIGTFVQGRWDYVGLAQLYPQLEAPAQLVPRKAPITNYEQTILYATETQTSGHGAKPGDPIQPVQKRNALKRKIKAVKYVDSIGWTRDQDTLQGKSGEHIAKVVQMDLVDFDLHYWQDLEHMLLQKPVNITPDDDETMFGLPAWVTDNSGQTALFELYGGDDPYAGGRPGGITVAAQSKFTNPVGLFDAITDANFFKMIEQFLQHRKLMPAVPNPGLIPDTPNDVCYVQFPVHAAITAYLQASNQDTGVDAGRYRGNPMFKQIPFVTWHALGHPDSPVKSATARGYIIDWNSVEYGVQSDYDRFIEGPMPIPGVPSGVYVTSELWHQMSIVRPDRNLLFTTTNPSLQP